MRTNTDRELDPSYPQDTLEDDGRVEEGRRSGVGTEGERNGHGRSCRDVAMAFSPVARTVARRAPRQAHLALRKKNYAWLMY